MKNTASCLVIFGWIITRFWLRRSKNDLLQFIIYQVDAGSELLGEEGGYSYELGISIVCISSSGGEAAKKDQQIRNKMNPKPEQPILSIPVAISCRQSCPWYECDMCTYHSTPGLEGVNFNFFGNNTSNNTSETWFLYPVLTGRQISNTWIVIQAKCSKKGSLKDLQIRPTRLVDASGGHASASCCEGLKAHRA